MQHGIERLHEWMWGYRAARVLHVLTGLKVFTHLDREPMTSGSLAAACRANEATLEKMLIAGVAMGLLERDAARYRNTAMSEAYLVEGKRHYQGNIIMHSARVWEVWSQLPDAAGRADLLNGDQGREHRDFILGMYNITMAGRGALFLESVDLSGRQAMADIGGGPGAYSILACQRYPELQATVFDLPETVAIAREVIGQHGLSERIHTVQGSWQTDDFGHGYDVVLLSNILHGPESMAGMILRKAYAAMDPGGLLAVQEFVLRDDKSGPLVPALFNVMVGAYSRAELTGQIEQAGFVDVQPVGQDDTVGSLWLTAQKR